jgi:spermidine synthase
MKKINKLILLIFFLSGIAGLSYQVVWVKLFANIFGHTIYAVSTVTAVFMAGLALGSYYFGILADKYKSPLRLYAFLEMGIAIYALLLFLLFPLFNDIYTWIFYALNLSFSSFSFSRLIFSIVLLIIPTSLIGGTFPVISKYYIQNIDTIKQGTGKLYSVNTLGAVTGVLLTGFVLIEWLGIGWTIYLAVIINLILAMLTYIISLKEKNEVTIIDASENEDRNESNFILYIYGFAGFAALALEVLWTRELSIVFFSSTYSFTTVLTVFLIGLALGSFWLSYKKIKPEKSLFYFSNLLIVLALFTLISIPLMRILPQKLFIESLAIKKMDWNNELILNFAISFAIIIIPTFIMGALFPLVCSIYTKSKSKLSTHLGKIYAFNTIGSVFGSILTGFVLIPLFGVLDSINLIFVLYMILVFIVIIRFNVFKNRVVIILVIASLSFFLYYSVIYKSGNFRPLPPDMKVLYAKEDISAEVKVLQNKFGQNSLYINEKQQGGLKVKQTERWAGEIPLLFHPAPDSVMLIGLGTGVTLNALIEGGAEHVTCAELIGSIKETSKYFKDINNDIISNKNQLEIVEADGINYLNLTRNKYDIILADIIHPDDVGASGLYSIEFYNNTKKKLKQGGFLAQWVVLDQIHISELEIILASFLKVFPNMNVFLGQETNQYQKLLLIGPENQFKIDIAKMQIRLKNASFVNELNGKDNIFSFLSGFVSCGNLLKDKINLEKTNSLINPRLEYMTPRHRWNYGKGMQDLEYLSRNRSIISDCFKIDSIYLEDIKKYFSARTNILNGRLAEFIEKDQMAEKYYLKAGLVDVDTLITSNHFSRLAWKNAKNSQMDQAVLNYKRAISVNRKNGVASMGLADLFTKMNKKDEAIDFYKYTVSIDTLNYRAYRRLGDLFTEKKQFDNAFYSYHMSHRLNDTQPVLHYILGQIYLNHKKNRDEATKYFRKSLELDPRHRYSSVAYDLLQKLESN